MKQFNLQEYLKNPNRKIITRDGCPVRIICTDANSKHSVIGLICLPNKEESVTCFYRNGTRWENSASQSDLFFAPKKKEGWIKVYLGKSRYNTFVCNRIFATKEESEKQKKDNVVAIIKIEWEE